jgi:hypothetical protein
VPDAKMSLLRVRRQRNQLYKHEVFARGVTMFQIAIAIAPIFALTRHVRSRLSACFFGVVDCGFLVLAKHS